MTGLIVSLILFGIVAIMLGVLFFIGAETKKSKLIVVIACVIAWLLCAFGVWGSAMLDANEWNNGYCECGGQWQPYGVSESRYGATTKYYYCPNCYTEIEQ